MGSLRITRAAPSSGIRLACSTSESISPRVPARVDEPDMELLARVRDRLARLAEVGDVVERVVQAEDVDAVVGRAGDEAADDVGRDRLRADEEAPAQGDPERRRRAGVERADALPRALDAPTHGGVERRRRPTPRGRRSPRDRASPRSAAPLPSGARGRAAPGRAGGSWCRRASASGKQPTSPGRRTGPPVPLLAPQLAPRAPLRAVPASSDIRVIGHGPRHSAGGDDMASVIVTGAAGGLGVGDGEGAGRARRARAGGRPRPGGARPLRRGGRRRDRSATSRTSPTRPRSRPSSRRRRSASAGSTPSSTTPRSRARSPRCRRSRSTTTRRSCGSTSAASSSA